MGQVTEREWPILQQQIAARDAAQGTEDYQAALKNLQNQITSSMERVKQAYEQTYGSLKFTPTEHVPQGRNEVSGKIGWDAKKESRYQELLRKQSGAK